MRLHTRLTTLGLIGLLICLTGCFWGRGGGYGGRDHEEQRHGDDGDRHDGDHHDGDRHEEGEHH
jgi:hypothetical protein